MLPPVPPPFACEGKPIQNPAIFESSPNLRISFFAGSLFSSCGGKTRPPLAFWVPVLVGVFCSLRKAKRKPDSLRVFGVKRPAGPQGSPGFSWGVGHLFKEGLSELGKAKGNRRVGWTTWLVTGWQLSVPWESPPDQVKATVCGICRLIVHAHDPFGDHRMGYDPFWVSTLFLLGLSRFPFRESPSGSFPTPRLVIPY